MHRTLVLVALAVLLVPMAQAAASGARSPIALDTPVNGVAIAATNGRFAAAYNDVGSTTMGEPDAPVWTLWNGDGSVRQSASADTTGTGNCPTPTNPITEDCRTHATRIAVSQDATRIAVASDQDMQTDLLTLFTDSGSRLFGPLAIDGTITDLAINQDGNRVAIAVRTAGGQAGDAADGMAQVYDSSGDELMGADGLVYEDEARRVALSPDGQTLVVAAGANHYYTGTGADRFHRISGTTATDVDASGVGGWTIAGFANGFFGLYNSGVTAAAPVEYQKKESGSDSSGLTAVAIRADATAFVTGSSGGSLRYYLLDTHTQADQATLVETLTGLGSVVNATFSADGRHLAVRSGADALRLYSATDSGLDELWKDTRATFGRSVAIDAGGEHVVANAGSTVIVYDAIHKLTAITPTGTQQPGTTADLTLTYRNDGNRMEDVALTANPPAGVSVSLNPPSFSVVPGATRAVAVTVTIPSTQAPGTLAIPIQHSLGGGDGTATSTITLTVPTRRDLRLEADGATSLAAAPGAVAVFHAVATNAGNVRETGALQVTSLPAGWTAGVEPEELDLAPGAFADVSVSLTPPSSAAHLSQANVRLERAGGPSLDLTATVGAGFKVRLTAPQGLVLAPGSAGLVNMTVRNDGNAPDTIVVTLGSLPAGWQGAFLSGLSEHRVEDLAPGEEQAVQATLRPPEGSESSVPVQVSFTGSSLGDPTQRSTRPILVTVQEGGSESDSETDDDKGAPGIPPMLLALALAALALSRKKRR